MKNKKLEQLKTMLVFYNNELNSLCEEEHKLNVNLLNSQEQFKNLDQDVTKFALGATIPTTLGALVAILFPCVMAYSIPSFIVAGCVTIISAYLAIPNYIKWGKNSKQINKLEKEIKNLTNQIEDNKAKIDIVKNKTNKISYLIDSYEKNSNATKNVKVQIIETKNSPNFKNIEMER